MILTLVIVLSALGIAMLLLTMWLVRSTRPERALLARLELMGTRRWRKATVQAKQQDLEAATVPRSKDATPSGGIERPSDIVAGVRLGPAEPPAVAAMATSPGAASVASRRDAEAEIPRATPAEAPAATDAADELESSDRVEDLEIIVSAKGYPSPLATPDGGDDGDAAAPSDPADPVDSADAASGLDSRSVDAVGATGDDGPERDAETSPTRWTSPSRSGSPSPSRWTSPSRSGSPSPSRSPGARRTTVISTPRVRTMSRRANVHRRPRPVTLTTDPGTLSCMATLDIDAMISRFRERALAVKKRPLPPVAGEEREQFLKQAKVDYQDFAMLGDAEGSLEDGVLLLRIDLRPADQRG